MAIKLPILFSQLDSRWAGLLLGNNTDSRYTIGADGCLLTDLAAICKYFGIDVNPQSLDTMLVNANGFQTGNGFYVWGALTKLFPQLTEKFTDTPNLLTDDQIAEIKSAIDNGFPVAIQIDYNPGTSNIETHYLVIVGYDNTDENNFTIFDPLGGIVHSLKDYLGFFRPSARNDINQYVIYSGPLQSVATDSCLLPNTPDNDQTFTDLVHGSGQWDATVQKYIPGSDPKHTDFDALQAVIGGIQSTATAANNKANQAAIDLAGANQQIVNFEEKLALEESQRQNDAEMYLAQIDALKPNAQATQKMIATFQGQIQALQGQVKELTNQKHDLAVALAKANAGQPNGWFSRILSILVNLARIVK